MLVALDWISGWNDRYQEAGEDAGAVKPGGQRICAVATAPPPQAAFCCATGAGSAFRSSPHALRSAISAIRPTTAKGRMADVRITYLRGCDDVTRTRTRVGHIDGEMLCWTCYTTVSREMGVRQQCVAQQATRSTEVWISPAKRNAIERFVRRRRVDAIEAVPVAITRVR
ncbi:hypothetical protein [Burkholderia stabilis]|uniref:hypothetical protein n=1 Tax=Burkholderia stabilis TaxID=95485 RepID=UPI0012FE3F61|nr:hypothetical protein [Burkholderia stabilis]